MGGDASIPVSEGDVLAGKYRVEKVLGSGGMGCVVAAMHEQLRQRVALKFMLPETLRNEEAVSRFIREARAAARLKSEHTVRVTDVGTLDSGSPYIVMEFLEGVDAKKLIEGPNKEPRPLEMHKAVDIILQACVALAEAHAAGIVHRDLKPQNLFITKRVDDTMLVKVLDFGISKDVSDQGMANSDLTDTRAVLGSPHYMSPEQMKLAKDVDPRSDIYSLGVCLYQLLSTKLPFEAPSIAELCLKVLSQDAVPLRSVRPEIPIGLETIVHKALARERADRHQSVAALASELETYADVTGKLSAQRVRSVRQSSAELPAAPPSAPDAAPTQAIPDGSTQGAWGTSAHPKRRPTLGIMLVMALFLVLGVAGALFFFRPKKEPVQNTGVQPSVSVAVTASDTAAASAPAAVTAPVTASVAASASASGKPIRTGGKPPKPGASVSPDQLLMDRN
jgi:serine/threonine-protein kinase